MEHRTDPLQADGRVLNVYMKSFGGAAASIPVERPAELRQVAAPVVPAVATEVQMEVDENTQMREGQNRLREDRRGGDEATTFPTGPRNAQSSYDAYYDRRPRQQIQQGGRYGPSGGDRYGGNRGRYYDDSRRYGGGGYGQRY